MEVMAAEACSQNPSMSVNRKPGELRLRQKWVEPPKLIPSSPATKVLQPSQTAPLHHFLPFTSYFPWQTSSLKKKKKKKGFTLTTSLTVLLGPSCREPDPAPQCLASWELLRNLAVNLKVPFTLCMPLKQHWIKNAKFRCTLEKYLRLLGPWLLHSSSTMEDTPPRWSCLRIMP